ncbi:MAG TPA: VWA domain-containing protein [Bryobacteraceae bacterium]|nr:VWA domain-containing protein [Bryobacteraceae bacterium]
MNHRLNILIAFFFIAATALPQTMPPQALGGNAIVGDDESVVFHAGTRLVLLHATVTNAAGKVITDIPKSAFTVYENGVEQPLKIFRREDVPVSMGIVVDNSASMREKRTQVAAAAMALVKASNPDDEMFIVNFNEDAYLDQPFTGDNAKLSQALDRIDSKGNTAMFDALNMSMNYLKDKGSQEKKVLLVITDGNDNTSATTLKQLVYKARQQEVLIYCIALLSDDEPREAKKAAAALKALTTATGGLDYYPKSLAEIDQITPEVAHEIRNQYILAYSPTNQSLDGSFRKVDVVVNGFGHPTVRTRNGYYASPEGGAR